MSPLSDETRELLARGRDGVPLSPQRRSAIRAGVLSKLTAAAVIATTTTSTKAATAAGMGAGWTTVALKVVGVGVLVAAIGGGTVAIVQHEGSRVATPAPTAPTVSVAPPRSTPAIPVGTADHETAAPPLSAPFVASAAEPVVAPPKRAAPSAAASPARPATESREPEPSSVVSPPVTQGASSLEAEVLLLREAHRALAAGDGGRSLRLLDEHAARFPSSALEPERSAERIFTLCQLKRTDSARVEAEAFLSSHPDGPLATRVRGSCARSSP